MQPRCIDVPEGSSPETELSTVLHPIISPLTYSPAVPASWKLLRPGFNSLTPEDELTRRLRLFETFGQLCFCVMSSGVLLFNPFRARCVCNNVNCSCYASVLVKDDWFESFERLKLRIC